MRIGVPKEVKIHEYRVGLTPESVSEFVHHGHEVYIETQAGQGINADDAVYEAAGAKIATSAAELYQSAEMIIKVKEPQAQERTLIRDGQVLFTYLHLAPDPEQAKDLTASGAVCIAYETVTDNRSGLPLLKPMSQVAGRMSIQAGASALEKEHGGRGVLLGGVPGVMPGKVVIVGGGTVGLNAAQMAVGLQADVTILDRQPATLETLSGIFGCRAKVIFSTRSLLEQLIAEADLAIGAVLVPGAAAPKLVTEDMIRSMKPGSAVVDVAIDQGGCFETSRATTHQDPTYKVHDIVHYCVANMPGAVAHTSTYALNNATLPYALAIADKGWKEALKNDIHLRNGLNICSGKVTYKAVADALGHEYVPAEDCLL
ncbi:MAG: alanine dehydrogenase [Methyloligellaceae bacterium]